MNTPCLISPPGAVLRITGDDHFSFLQGQGTADLRGPVGLCRYCLWLDFKGQIQGDAFVLKESEESMLLVSYATSAEDLMAKFNRHIIADDVEIEDLTAQFHLVSCATAGFPEALSEWGWKNPEVNQFVANEAAYCFVGRRLGLGFLDVLVPLDSDLKDRFSGLDPLEAEALRIGNGVPSIPADADDSSLNPLEAGMISPISFDKGCYLGQEVVARVHRLQRVSRRLVLISGITFPANPGTDLLVEGKCVGRLTSVAGNGQAIGWLKSRVSEGVQSFDGPPVTVMPLVPS